MESPVVGYFDVARDSCDGRWRHRSFVECWRSGGLAGSRRDSRKSSGMSEVIHDRKAAIRNTIVYAIALLLALAALV
jgi:hypothetical protein